MYGIRFTFILGLHESFDEKHFIETKQSHLLKHFLRILKGSPSKDRCHRALL